MHLNTKWYLSSSKVEQWPSFEFLQSFKANDSHDSKSNLLAYLPFISLSYRFSSKDHICRGCAMASQEGEHKCFLPRCFWMVIHQHEIWTNSFCCQDRATSSLVWWQPWAVNVQGNAKCSGTWNMEMYHSGETAKRQGEASLKPLSLQSL